MASTINGGDGLDMMQEAAPSQINVEGVGRELTPQEEYSYQQQADAMASQLEHAAAAAYEAAMKLDDPVAAANLMTNAQQLKGMAASARNMPPRMIATGGLGPMAIAAVAVMGHSMSERREAQYDAIYDRSETAAVGSTYFREAGYEYSPYDMSSQASQQYWAQQAMRSVDDIQHQQDERFYQDESGATRLKGSELSGEQIKDMTSLTTVDKLDVSRSTEQKLTDLAGSEAFSPDAQQAIKDYAKEIHERGNSQMLDEIAGSDYNVAAERTWDKLSDAQKTALGGDKDKFTKDFVEGQKDDEGAMTAAKAADIKKAYAELPADADPRVRTQMEKRVAEAEFYEKFLDEKKELLKEGAQEQSVKDERVVAAIASAEAKAKAEGKTLTKEEMDKVIAEAKKIEAESPEKAKEALEKAKEKAEVKTQEIQQQQQQPQQAPDPAQPQTVPGTNHAAKDAPAQAVTAAEQGATAAAADQSVQIAPDSQSVGARAPASALSPAEQAAMDKFGFLPKGLQYVLAMGSILNVVGATGGAQMYGDPPLQSVASSSHAMEALLAAENARGTA